VLILYICLDDFEVSLGLIYIWF